MPAENISETFSTSLVARVTSRPTGIVSKKPRWSRWMCANTSRRRSRIAAWPVRDITSGSMNDERPRAPSRRSRGGEQRAAGPAGASSQPIASRCARANGPATRGRRTQAPAPAVARTISRSIPVLMIHAGASSKKISGNSISTVDEHLRAVRRHVAPEPPRETRVVGLAERLLLEQRVARPARHGRGGGAHAESPAAASSSSRSSRRACSSASRA